MSIIILIILFLAFLGVLTIIYFSSKHKSEQNGEDKKVEEKEKGGFLETTEDDKLQLPSNFLYPKEFNAGMLIDPSSVPPVMNDCNKNIRYPLNSIDVDYGWKFPSNCRCLEFIQPP